MKRVYLSLAFLVVLAFASSASACEDCKRFNDTSTCWSGLPFGWQWCYGGFGEPCTVGGLCRDRYPNGAPLTPTEQVCLTGVLGCTSGFDAEASPSGFVLEKPAGAAAPQRPQVKDAS